MFDKEKSEEDGAIKFTSNVLRRPISKKHSECRRVQVPADEETLEGGELQELYWSKWLFNS